MDIEDIFIDILGRKSLLAVGMVVIGPGHDRLLTANLVSQIMGS